DRLVERRLVLRIALLRVDPQQELRGLRRPGIVERGVSPVVLELLHPPGVLANGVVPLAQRAVAAEVDHVVPSARWMLSPDQRAGDLLRRLVVVVVASGVIC